VVAGLIVAPEGRVLIAQRREDQAMPLKWELPGGKIEIGESPERALVRELREELGVTVEVGRIWEVLHHRYERFELLMLVYHCRIAGGGPPRCCEVKRIAWCFPRDLSKYDFLPADRSLVERLMREGIGEAR
jgi:8-oxo-dGTP diphosphatase